MFYSKLMLGVFQVVSNHRTITDCFVVFAELLQFERAITVQVSQVYGILQCTNTWLLPASSLCIAQCGKCSFLMYRNWGSPRNELQQGEHCPLHYFHNLQFQHLTHSLARSSGDPTAVLPTPEGGYPLSAYFLADCFHHIVVMTTETLDLQYREYISSQD